jgi:RES domain-containing protein
VARVETKSLPIDWRDYPPPRELRQIGNAWFASGRTVVLGVPSAIVPEETNYLLNPQHKGFKKIRVSAPRPFAFDPRLWDRDGS